MKRSRRTTPVVLACVGLLASSVARAEDPASVDPIVVGSKVRLRTTTVQRALRGTVVDMDERSLVVSDRHRPVRVSREDITRLEVSTGRRGQAIKGMAIGAAIGGGTFAVISRDEYCADYDPGEECPSRAEMVATGLLGGALWGALIGHFLKTERWGAVTLDRAQVRVTPSRARGGVGLAVSVAW